MEKTFIIKEIAKNEFIVLKLYKEIETTGYLWWKKTIEKEVYHRVDKYCVPFSFYLTNYQNMVSYKSKKEAKEFIKNYSKYPMTYFY